MQNAIMAQFTKKLRRNRLLTWVVFCFSSGSGLLSCTGGTQVVAWGDNSQGQTNVPPGLTNVIAISGGGLHNLVLKSDGTVVAWGYNCCGQTNVSPGLSNVIAIAAGTAHSVALKSDGTVVAWGDGGSGQTDIPPG